jgi:hypothetical protein
VTVPQERGLCHREVGKVFKVEGGVQERSEDIPFPGVGGEG